jgi:DNA polymerase III sliding clamp (beta) subunit (PCNA family)
MDLTQRLRIVRRATHENAMLPALKAIHVYDGRMQSTDGRITIDVECAALVGMNFTVNGTKFVKAIEACNGAPDKLEVKEGTLIIKKGSFRAKLPLLDPQAFPLSVLSSPASLPLVSSFRVILDALKPFIGKDASRLWACGILFKENKAYATNNTVVARAEYKFSSALEPFNLPGFTVDELLLIEQEPMNIIQDDGHVTFVYDSFWVRSQTFSNAWPDIDKMIPEVKKLPEVPAGLKDAVDKIVDFCPDADFQCVVFDENFVKTTEGEISAEVGGFSLPKGRYRAVVLQNVLAHAINADFSFYPNAIPFKTDNGLSGVFVGVRQ